MRGGNRRPGGVNRAMVSGSSHTAVFLTVDNETHGAGTRDVVMFYGCCR